MENKEKIPYKIFLTEEEMPRKWHNVRAVMKESPSPLCIRERENPARQRT